MNKTLTYTLTLCLMALSSPCFIAPLSASTIKIEKLVQLGHNLNSAGNYSQAEALFTNALTLEEKHYNKLVKKNAKQQEISVCRFNIYQTKKNLGNVLSNRHKFKNAANYLQEALDGYQGLFGKDKHHSIPEIKKNLGIVLAAQGTDKTLRKKAKGYLIDALSMQKENYKKAQQKTYATPKKKKENLALHLAAISDTEVYLGDLVMKLGHYEEASNYLESAQEGCGNNLVRQAQIMQSLGTLYSARGLYKKAETSLRGALFTQMSYLQRQTNPSPQARLCIISTQQALAKCLIKRNQYDEAEKYLNAIIETPIIRDRKAEALQSLGRLLSTRGLHAKLNGEFKKAEQYYQTSELKHKDSLKIWEGDYPDNHLDIARARIDLYYLWTYKGDFQKNQQTDTEKKKQYKKARKYYKAAESGFETELEVIKRYYDDGHPEIAQAEAYLGSTKLKLGHFKSAYRYLNRSFITINNNLGDDHIDTKNMRTRFAKILIKQGDYENALTQLQKALKTNKKYYGDNFETAILQTNLGRVLVMLGSTQWDQKRYHQALRTYKKQKKKLGSNHSSANNMLYEQANNRCKDEKKRYETAKRYYEKALTYLTDAYNNVSKTYGKNHHRTARLMRKLADVHIRLSYNAEIVFYSKAEEKLKAAQVILLKYYKKHNYRKTKKILNRIEQNLEIASRKNKKRKNR